MEKYVEMIKEQIEGDLDYLSNPSGTQTDDQYEETLKEVKTLDKIVREHKKIEAEHEEEMSKIKSECRTTIMSGVGETVKVLGLGLLGCLALFKDEDSVFSKQLLMIGERLTRLF